MCMLAHTTFVSVLFLYPTVFSIVTAAAPKFPFVAFGREKILNASPAVSDSVLPPCFTPTQITVGTFGFTGDSHRDLLSASPTLPYYPA
jgi:hypothetical protein